MNSNSSFISEFSTQDFTAEYQVDFYQYWQKICGDRTMPSRADIHPEEIVKILPYIILFEKKEDDFVVRLMGTKCADVLGELTGKKMTDTEGGREAIDRFNWCVEKKLPYFHMKPLEEFNKDHVHASAIVLPLSNNDKDVNMIILAHHFY